jgi:uncharacterized protein (DUF305 family)
MKTSTAIGALALLASLGACGSSQQPAIEETPAAEMTMDGPFADAEMAMDKAMKTAVGVDAADTWVKKMIAHHEGAIAMSRTVLDLEPTPEVAKIAQATIDNRGAEVEALKALARSGAANPDNARLYDAAMAEMHTAMMSASGDNPSQTYLAKMLAHHRGAVTMSDIALANGATGAVRAQIEETRTEQLKEVAMVEAMLRGEPMATQTQAARDTAAPEPAAKPAAAKATAQKPAAAKPAAAKPAPKPAPEPEASPTCAPEHRAAGHC